MKRTVFSKFLLLVVLFTCPLNSWGQTSAPRTMAAHFINVGQGAATLLEFPCGAMLIDAGEQDQPAYQYRLTAYLNRFFARRTDLNRTLDVVVVTHSHIDHNSALKEIAQTFTIKRYVDNGISNIRTSGGPNQTWLQQSASSMGVAYANYTYEQATIPSDRQGISDLTIDPFVCTQVNPDIRILSGRFANKPATWSNEEYGNGNNQSLVIKVLFGRSSFLFTGDLELKGMDELLRYYTTTTGTLNADILHVGHHGAKNAVTAPFVQAVTPRYAVISCGPWDFGKLGNGVAQPMTTYAFGHPTVTAIKLLSNGIPINRAIPTPTDSVMVGFKGAPKHGKPIFIRMKVTGNIYATPWDGTMVIEATDTGLYKIRTQQ